MHTQRPLCQLSFLSLFALLTFGCDATTEGADRLIPSVFNDEEIQEWRLSDSPEVVIGGADGRDGYLFYGPPQVAVVGDHLAVADGAAREVRFYRFSGELVARQGRDGSGPGEFRAMQGLTSYGDSAVAIWDPLLGRITIVGIDGNLARMFSPDVEEAMPFSVLLGGATTSGDFVFHERRRSVATPAGERRDSIHVSIVDSEGRWIRELGAEAGEEVFQLGGVGTPEPIILGRQGFLVVSGDDLVFAASDSLFLRRIGPDGSLVRAVLLHHQTESPAPFEIAEEHEKRFRERERPSQLFARIGAVASGVEQADAQVDDMLRNLPSRQTMPAFQRLEPGAAGSVWVGAYVLSKAPERIWLNLDPEFEPVARIRIPTDIDVRAFTDNHVIARSRDELDREMILLYRIIR